MRLPLLLLALALAGCRYATTSSGAAGTDDGPRPDSETWGARLTATTDGRPTMTLEAPYLARWTDSSRVVLGPMPGAAPDSAARVRVRLLAADGTDRLALDAARVRLDERTQALDAAGRVVATLAGARVEAPRLTAEGEAFTATGGATVQLSGETTATLRARRVTGRDGRYEATGGVVVESAGRTLRSERVVYDAGAGRFAAPGAFAFDGAAEAVRGVDLSASADLSRYTFRRASGQIEVQE